MNELKSFNIRETQIAVFSRDNWKCQYHGCNKKYPEIELAHIIGQTRKSKRNQKLIQKLWFDITGKIISLNDAEGIVHNKYLLVSSCQKHNSYFMISKPLEIKEKLKELNKLGVK